MEHRLDELHCSHRPATQWDEVGLVVRTEKSARAGRVRLPGATPKAEPLAPARVTINPLPLSEALNRANFVGTRRSLAV